jgi:hypothetical protein
MKAPRTGQRPPPSTYTPPAPYAVISLESLLQIDLAAWQATKEAIERAKARPLDQR